MNTRTAYAAFLFTLLALIPLDVHALSTVGQYLQGSRYCTGTLVGSLTSSDGTFDGISEAQLPANYATPGLYCIQESRSRSCEDFSDVTVRYNLYNTGSTANYTPPNACYLPDMETPVSPLRQSRTTLTYVTPTATLTLSPSSINQGGSALLTWGSQYMTSCTGTNFSTGNAVSGSISVNPSNTTTYGLSCTGPSGSASAPNRTLTVIPPLSDSTVSCSVSPTSVNQNQNVTWTVNVTGGTPPYTYEWAGDNLFGETGASAIVSYLSGGTKTGQVTVTDSSAIPSSTTLSSSWTWNRVCTGTYTGYSESDIEDGGTWTNSRNHLANFQNISPAPAGFSGDGKANYCLQGEIRQDCPPTGSGTCYYYLDWMLYNGSGTASSGSWGPNVVCNGAQGGWCQQNAGGARTWSVSTTPSTQNATVIEQCPTVSVNNSPSAPTLSCPSTLATGALGTFTFTASDPEGNQIRYGADWGNDATIDEWKPSASTYVASGISQNFTHSFSSPGTYTVVGYARDSNGNQSQPSSCDVTVSNSPPTATLSANPASIATGASSLLTWGSTNATQCQGTGFSTNGAPDGTATVYPPETTEYNVTCTNATGGTPSGGTWISGEWWSGGTETVLFSDTYQNNGQQGDLCPNAAGGSAWNEKAVTRNVAGDAGEPLITITCYSVTGATGTVVKPYTFENLPGGGCIGGCWRETSYRRSGASTGGSVLSSGSASATATVTVSGPELTATNLSPAGGTSINTGVSTAFQGRVNNTGTGSATNVPNILQVCNGTGTCTSLNALVSATTLSSIAAGGNGTVSANYTFASGLSGSYSYRFCADNNTSWVGTNTENDETNNCSAWTPLTISTPSPAPIANLSCVPASCSAPTGYPVTLNYSCQNSTSATLTTFGSLSPVSSGSRDANTAGGYTLTCTAGSLTDEDIENVSFTVPTVNLTATPDRVLQNGSVSVSWISSPDVTDCTITRAGAAFATGANNTGTPAPNITTQTVFAASCTSGGIPGAATDTAIVNVVPEFEEF